MMQNRFRNLLLIAAIQVSSVTVVVADEDSWPYEDKVGAPHSSNVPDGSSYHLYLKDPEGYRLKSDHSEDHATPQTTSPGTVSVDPRKLPFAALVTAAAIEQKIDPALLHAIIHVESRHNPSAISPKGAIGLMQVLPETARRMGIKSIRTPQGNISAGARYFRFLLDIFGKDTQLALAAYNAGENAVIQHGNQIPPYPETLAYVPAVIAAYNELRNQKANAAW
jgi:soluble lytic murein transglycosylase-like protein